MKKYLFGFVSACIDLLLMLAFIAAFILAVMFIQNGFDERPDLVVALGIIGAVVWWLIDATLTRARTYERLAESEVNYKKPQHVHGPRDEN